MSDFVKKDRKNRWYYLWGNPSSTFVKADKSNNTHLTCVLLSNWGLRELGILKESQLIYQNPSNYELRFSNGAVLCYNSAFFYNIDTILSVSSQDKEKSFPEDYIILGEIIGDGEMLCYSKKNREYVSLFEGREKHFNTFSDCLNKIIRRIRNKVGEYADL